MDPEAPIPRKGRETLVSILLVVILGGIFLVFLNFVTFGVVFHVAAAIAGLALVGFLHYVLWGYSLSQEVAGEREEERLKERMEADAEFERDQVRYRPH